MNIINFLLIPFIARICLVAMFPVSAYDKIVHWDEAMDQARSAPVRGASLMLVAAIVIEVLTPVCIIFGWHDRFAAFILAGFCVITAILYHQFWKFPDFWSKPGEGRAHFWDFLKNFCIVGGLLLVLAGATYAPLSYVLLHPFSSVPYTPHP